RTGDEAGHAIELKWRCAAAGSAIGLEDKVPGRFKSKRLLDATLIQIRRAELMTCHIQLDEAVSQNLQLGLALRFPAQVDHIVSGPLGDDEAAGMIVEPEDHLPAVPLDVESDGVASKSLPGVQVGRLDPDVPQSQVRRLRKQIDGCGQRIMCWLH